VTAAAGHANPRRHVIQLSDGAWERHGEVLAAEHPNLSWLVVGADSLQLDGVDVAREDAKPTIAWFGYDVLSSDAVRRHFGLARRAESLELALTSYAGLDGKIWSEFAERGVVVTGAHLSGVPISQFVMARVLEWYHQPAGLDATRRNGEWVSQAYIEIESTTWVVVGFGAIGSNVAKRAQAFGAQVVGVRRNIDGTEIADEMVTFDRLDEVTSGVDVIVFAVPETDTTKDLVDAEFLARLKPSAVLVNVGRGSLIIEHDLVAALDAGNLGVAILDVTRTEPLPPESPLWSHPKVMLSTHTSASGSNRHTRSRDHFSANLHRYLAGDPLTR